MMYPSTFPSKVKVGSHHHLLLSPDLIPGGQVPGLSILVSACYLQSDQPSMSTSPVGLIYHTIMFEPFPKPRFQTLKSAYSQVNELILQRS